MLCVCVCPGMCVCEHVCVCVCVDVCEFVCTCKRVCGYTSVYVFLPALQCVEVCKLILWVFVFMSVGACVCQQCCVSVCVCIIKGTHCVSHPQYSPSFKSTSKADVPGGAPLGRSGLSHRQ